VQGKLTNKKNISKIRSLRRTTKGGSSGSVRERWKMRQTLSSKDVGKRKGRPRKERGIIPFEQAKKLMPVRLRASNIETKRDIDELAHN